MDFTTTFCGISHDGLMASTLDEVGFDGPPEDRQLLRAAGHFALVNASASAGAFLLAAANGKAARREERKLKREVFHSTMRDLERVGSVTAVLWILRPVFMWLLRRYLQRLIDRYFFQRSLVTTSFSSSSDQGSRR